MKVLVVEDNASYAKVAKETLENAGHIVIMAHCLEKALATIGETEVVLTDLHFPEKPRQAWREGNISKAVITALFLDEEELYTAAYRRLMIDELNEVELAAENIEVPLGLRIAGEAYRRKIPCSIITDGDRHAGRLGILRYYLAEAFGGKDFARAIYSGGLDVYKERGATWIDALVRASIPEWVGPILTSSRQDLAATFFGS